MPKRSGGVAVDLNQQPLASLRGVGPSMAEKLAARGLLSVQDLWLHLPRQYEDRTALTAIRSLQPGVAAQVEGKVEAVERGFRYRPMLRVAISDEMRGTLVLRFFHFRAQQVAQFSVGARVRAYGTPRPGQLGLEMVHPSYRILGEGEHALGTSLDPVYPEIEGIGPASLRKLMAQALEALPAAEALELLPADARDALRLPSLREALLTLHRPPRDADVAALQAGVHPAQRRLALEELLAHQLSLRRQRIALQQQGAQPLPGKGRLVEKLRKSLPFALTGAQQRVRAELASDLAQPYPMQRLLQGDVGSGKTIVAALAACQAIEAGWQAAFMAPTEILAEQHYLKLRAWLEPLGVEVAWLSGSLKKAAKKAMLSRAASSAQLIVGTHALIQDGVDFARLGLAIVDEQHRFGVAQRLELRRKGGNPHQLMMSATPIPRTLAMSYYADLDVSVLDELPPGRQPITTKLVSDARRDEVIARVRGAVASGRQAYWVCPLIEESETLQLQTAIDTHAALCLELDELRIGLVHGRLKSDEKAAAMAAFAAGEIDVLVATTVIEVGVDVPNASLMVIEHAERFGLSQLHQLRGRVGRGVHDSVCVLLFARPLSETARARLKIIFENTDGFEIARQDLQLRGPGEFVGSRQSGVPLLRYADLEVDDDLVELARSMAEQLLRDDPACARRHLARWLGSREELLKA